MTFDGSEPRLALYSSLILPFRPFRKNAKNRCEHRCFLMAQNLVWRYTLRLFHTFAIFEKIEKSMQNEMPKVVLVRSAATADPY